MRLTVRPTVFHPRYFMSSERFAEFVGTLDLRGKHVIDVGTGTGILAIAAARSGAETVLATDINPNAVLSVPENARANGVGRRIIAVCMDLLSAFVAAPLFDVIIANVPKHTDEPRDVADRGWHGGPGHCYIIPTRRGSERLKYRLPAVFHIGLPRAHLSFRLAGAAAVSDSEVGLAVRRGHRASVLGFALDVAVAKLVKSKANHSD